MSKERNNTRAWTAEEQKIDDSNPAQLAEAKKMAGVTTHENVTFKTIMEIDEAIMKVEKYDVRSLVNLISAKKELRRKQIQEEELLAVKDWYVQADF